MPLVLAEINWNSLLRDDDFVMPVMILLAIAIVGVILLTATIALQWRRIQQARDETGLKEQMIQRGFSAAEIERVLRAGVGHYRTGKVAKRLGRFEAAACY